MGAVAATIIAAAFIVLGCSSVMDHTVVDQSEWLKDGAALSWKLDPGTYKLEVTSSGDGASVEWVGASCPGNRETRSYSSICELPQTGQVIVSNPTALGLGADVSVTVKITKLAR